MVVRVLSLLLLVRAAPAADRPDPCAATSPLVDVQMGLALKDRGAVFQFGEIVPLVLTFTSSTQDRYSADVRNYDRSGRLGTEYYCVEPEAKDPLESYFRVGGFMGGGLGGVQVLGTTPLQAGAELNEWRTLAPGHYRVYAISNRVWRPPDPGEDTPYGRISGTVRSNTIEIVVNPPDPAWQSEQLWGALQTLGGKPSAEEAKRAARVLRFLNTQESTRQLARLFWGLNEQPGGWDLMFGLYGSPFRQLAIDSMHAELADPGHAITNEFLRALVNLQVTADAAWDPPARDLSPEDAKAFWARRQEHVQERMRAEVRTVIGALARKTGGARATTLYGLLTSDGVDATLGPSLRPALAAAWADLPRQAQQDLILYRWPMIAGREMLPILQRMVVEQPAPGPRNTEPAMLRDAALKHLFELDPAAGRESILGDLQNPNAHPGLDVIQLLSKEDVVAALPAAVERIGKSQARELDYELVDRYADAGPLLVVRAAYEKHAGKWACLQQSAMLRYFLRVAPEYGIEQIGSALGFRKDTGCYRTLLSDLGAALPKVQPRAVEALDDSNSEVVRDAARALERWGTPEAEDALWARLKRLHEASGDRELEQALVFAIAKGTNWPCPPEKLARVAELTLDKGLLKQIEDWIKQWKQEWVVLNPFWLPDDRVTFSILQYDQLTEDQLHAVVSHLPRGTELRWQVLPDERPGYYERLRAAVGPALSLVR